MQEKATVVWRVLPDAKAVALAAVDEIRKAEADALAAGGRFRILLAGGTTPLTVYGLIARERLSWDGWEVYFGDERCLPPGDPERNSLAAEHVLLGSVSLPGSQIHPIPAETGAERAARAYECEIEQALPFDLVLLGMGEDGHTASLFPGQEVDDARLVIPVHGAPKPPPDRVSLTFTALAQCRRMLILVTGAAKRDALRAWRSGTDLPVARAAQAAGALVLADGAAAGL
jgi:6-phosphogluconolactonase